MKNITSFIPTGFTLLNAICGFFSIFLSFQHDFTNAGILIILAAVFDLFDGRTARLLKVSHDIGKELDSFADFLSFGVAPAFLVINMAYSPFLVNQMPPIFLLLAGAFYISCAALRLAVFNNPQNTFYAKVPKNKANDFLGIPSTFSGFIVAFLASYLSFYHGFLYSPYISFVNYPLFMMISLILLAIFMLLPIPYPKLASRIFNFNSGFNILFNCFLILIFLLFGRLSFIFYILYYIFWPLIMFFAKRNSYKVFK